MERLPRYKSFFEKNEGADKALSLKEKVEGYQKKLDYLKFRLSEVAAAAAPVAAAPVEEQETAEDVIKKGMSNLAVTIVKDYGLESEALDKLIKMARSMGAEPTEEAPAEEPAPSEDELQLDLGDEGEAPAEEAPAEDELNLDLGDETEAPAEEPAAEAAPATEQPAEEPAGKKKSQPEIEKDLDLDDEATKPLDLADFSFKA